MTAVLDPQVALLARAPWKGPSIMTATLDLVAAVLQSTWQAAEGDLESLGGPFNNECNVGSPSGPACGAGGLERPRGRALQ